MTRKEREKRKRESKKPNIISSIIGTIFAIILIIKGCQTISENYAEDDEYESSSISYEMEG